MSDFAIPWTAALQASLSFTVSWSLLKLVSFESVNPSNHLILCRPLLLLPSIFASIRIFSSKSAIRSGGQSVGASASASVPPMNIWTDFLWDGLVGFPCSPRDSQKSSPTPQFKSINSSGDYKLINPKPPVLCGQSIGNSASASVLRLNIQD